MQASESALPVSMEAFRDALECHAIVSITDATGNIVYANQRFCDISGYSQNELIGQSHRIVKSGIHPDDFYRELWITISSGKNWHGEVCNRARDGSLYWVQSTIVPVLDQAGLPAHYISTRTDITAQKRQAEHILELANEQNELLRIAPVGIARLDGRAFQKVNHAFAGMLGYESAELIGASTRQIYSSYEQFEAVGLAAYETLKHGGHFSGETCLRKKDGTPLWVIMGVCTLTPEDPVRNTLFIVQDISVHKQLEEKLAKALEKSRAAEHAKQAFLDSMTHQMHTPLNGILGVTQLLAMHDFEPDIKSLIETCMASAKHLLHMVDRSLQFAALDGLTNSSARLETCSISECIDVVVRQFGGLAKASGIAMSSAIPASIGAIEFSTDQEKMRQVLGLIIDNAIRYNHPDGSVTISAAVNERNVLSLLVTDTGYGLSPEQLQRLGEPFIRFDKKDRPSGAGLGMALAYRLADILGAEINISSELGQGTSVRLDLPGASPA